MKCGVALNPNLPLPATFRVPAFFPLGFSHSILFQVGASGGSDLLPAPGSKTQAHGPG